MPRTAQQLRATIAAARSMPMFAFGDITEAEARADRDAAIADLETELAQRESEEAGSWLGQHP
ncbi:hypothetical protein [Amycolatopsis sp. NPDC051903]|uniref:hypothetical protein n=1 Tax=Amycolatopsis sp. NPDC051903 TaxID=3363936 RepID=UPI0037A2534D